MLQFKYPEMEDRAWLQPVLSQSGNLGSESAFGTLFLWKNTYHSKICRYEDHVLLCSGEHFHTYNLPVGGEKPFEAVEILIADASERGIPFKMWGVSPQGAEKLESMYPGRFTFELDRNGADYIYRSADLIGLSGRKYHGKRNHLAQFNRDYSWSYEEIGAENLEDCRKVALEWCRSNGGCEEEAAGGGNERCALRRAFENFEALHLAGGLIRIDGKPAAFTIGEEINPTTYLLHFEKALDGYNGLYAAINHEFAARHLEKYEYINREEDLGLEGLRRAKLSYHPAFLLEKYLIKLKEESKVVSE
jgi:hypothetical protein